jgi:hypothetical protein
LSFSFSSLTTWAASSIIPENIISKYWLMGIKVGKFKEMTHDIRRTTHGKRRMAQGRNNLTFY